jgi:dipeptidyl-peptidase 4
MTTTPFAVAGFEAGRSGGLLPAWRVLFLFALACASPCLAEQTNNPLLTIDRIFSGDEFNVQSYGRIVWKKRGPGYYKFEKPDGGGAGRDLVAIDPASGNREVIVPAHAFIPSGESTPLAVDSYEFSEDESKLLIYTNSRRVWRQNTRGDYWVLDLTGRDLKKVGADCAPSTLLFAKFSPDASRVAYVRENNLYVQNLRDLEVTALTTNGSATLINGTFDWVYEEELNLRDGFRWSPDGNSIAYWQLDTTGVREFFLVNNTDGLYSRVESIPYPKTGEQNAAARIGVVASTGGETRWLDMPGDPRNHYLARMDWASDSAELLIQQFNRVQNTNRVMIAQAATGEVRTILTETDAAWLENENPAAWIDDGSHFLWLSERDGWRHAYRVARDGKISRITQGDFDVVSIQGVDERNGWLYFIASPDNPTQRYLYRAQINHGNLERLTPADQPGSHSYNISPDGEWAIHTGSSFTNPPITRLIQLPAHNSVRLFEENKALRDKIESLNKPASEFFRVDIGENVLLDGWCLKPPDFDPEKKYPLLFYVYGEPHGQTVRDAWMGRNHLWHWMLAQKGYVVLSVDNRGTPAPRGRDWRKVVHRQIGVLTVADQAAAARAILKERPYLDPERVGIWGWSGGGSSTLNALLQYPGVYHTGMAVASVPNMRYYDTIYQERYMGLPEDNPDGYRKGSAVTHAHQLQGNLLIVHGTGDDNCHYQGAEALINELIAHNKPFTMMAYPNRRHGISEGRNTTRHLFTLLTRFLEQHLPAGGGG